MMWWTISLLHLLLFFTFSLSVQGVIFSTEPKSVLVPKGSTATVKFECSAGDELSDPVYSWMKNRKFIDFKNSSHYQLHNGDLYITSPEDGDTASYQCVIQSDEGTVASNEAELEFQYLYYGDPKTNSPKEVLAGTGVKLRCGSIDINPEYSAFFYWEERDKFLTIGPTGNSTHYVSQKSGTLYLANPKTGNSGTYQCLMRSMWKAANSYMRVTGDISSLVVDDAVWTSHPDFLLQPDIETRVALNGKTLLECFASGNPTPNITWTFKGGKLPAGAQVTESGQLFFSKATKDCEGEYVCTATNTEGSITAQGKLVLEYPPIWTSKITTQYADLASSVTWTCAADAVPIATYSWWKNGVNLLETNEDPKIQIEVEEDRTTLTITDLEEDHAGMYQCAAKNSDGNIISSAQLVVNSYEPVIAPIPSLIYAPLGGQVRVPCDHTAAPVANVTWLVGDLDVISPGAKFLIGDDGSLTILNVEEQDAQEYVCEVTNILGDDKASTTIQTVQPTVMTTYPKNITSLRAQSSGELYCAATHDSSLLMNWEWTINGNVIRPMFDSKYFVEGGQLIINSATSQQSGMYRCCAVTEVGTPCGTAEVVVIAPPDLPTGVVASDATSTSQIVSWEVPFDNHSPILGYVLEVKNSFSESWMLARTNRMFINETSVMVIQLYPYNDYIYRVFALNDVGRSEPSEPSDPKETLGGTPAKAPSGLGGGGGQLGQLVVTWEPLAEEYYGSDTVAYVVAIQKRPLDTGVILPIPPPGANETTPKEPEAPWTQITTLNTSQDTMIFSVNESEIYTPYNFKIRADNEYGEGPWSRIKIVHTAEQKPDKAPKNLRLRKKAEAFEAQFLWEPLLSKNGRTRGYTIRIQQKTGSPNSDIYKTTEKALPGVVVDKLVANTVYYAYISGYNSAGQGPWSQPFTFSTSKLPPQNPPTEVKVSILGTLLKASWKPITQMANNEANLQGYKVQYWYSDSSSKYAFTRKTVDNSLEFSIPNNSLFNVWVRGYSQGGDGRPSQIFYISTGTASKAGYKGSGDGANAVTSSTSLIMLVSFLWMLFVKLDL